MTGYVSYEDVEIQDYTVNLEVESSLITVDHGIGHYEFWGSTGYHEDIRVETDGALEYTIEAVYNEDGDEIDVTPNVKQLVNEWINNNDEQIRERIIEENEE